MKCIGQLYEVLAISEIEINHMSGEDPVAKIVSKFTEMAKITTSEDISDEK